MKTVTVAEFKRRFSDLVAEVRYRGERIIVARRDTPVAALVGLDDLKKLSSSSDQSNEQKPRLGLLGAVGAWGDYDDLDKFIEDIYAAREAAIDRPAPILED